MARLGILSLASAELLQPHARLEARTQELLSTMADWLVGLINANPAAKRPVLDIQHIELFLVWVTLWQVDRTDDIYAWLRDLQLRLFVRRAGIARLPFIEAGNSLEVVFEYAATNTKPYDFRDQSSLLLLVLIELCFSLEPSRRDELIGFFYKQLVLALDTNGEPLEHAKPMDLMIWAPPEDWQERVLAQSLADEGEVHVLPTVEIPHAHPSDFLTGHIRDFIRQSRGDRQIELTTRVPAAVLVLACLKHGSPLPPEFWRYPIFGPHSDQTAARKPNKKSENVECDVPREGDPQNL